MRGQNPNSAGSDPTFAAFSRPKVCGVAPGQSPKNSDRVFPRAYRNVFDTKSIDEENSIAERRRSQCQS
jgi:hypothetical protein